jgi:type IV pilus assembly protein PilC
MLKLPDCFSPETVQLIEAGEGTESSGQVLSALAEDYRHLAASQRSLRLALLWPLSLVVIILAALLVLSIYVLPAFREAYVSFGSELPQPTEFVLDVADLIAHHWWVWLPLLLLGVALWRLGRMPPAIGRGVRRLFGLWPFVRRNQTAQFLVRLTHWLEVQPANTRIRAAALAHLCSTTDQSKLAEAARQLGQAAAQGAPLSKALAAVPALPRRLSLYAQLGERMADLTAPLAQLAEGAEADEQEAAVRFERGCILALYLFLGGTVAVAVIAIYLPIFRLGSII